MAGFIQLHRNILEWEWWDDHKTSRLFVYCLLKANHKDKKWRGTVVKRGSFLTGREILSSETGLSQQSIRTSLNKLKATSELTIKSTNKGTVITVVNYDSYQGVGAKNNQQLTSESTNHQPTINQQLTTTNNDNNINNDNKVIPPNPHDDEFDYLWLSWRPYEMAKGNKKTALQKYKTIRKGLDYETIRDGVARYIEYCHATQCKTKHVSTWLNQNGWDDDYTVPDSQNKKTSYLDSIANASRTVQADMEADFDQW